MPGYFEVRLSTLVRRQSEVRMAEDRETLSADGSGRERRLRPGRLSDVNDPCFWRRSLGGGADQFAPQRVYHQGGPVSPARFT